MMKKHVFFRMNGGLGNQMFEYAFLYALLRDSEIENPRIHIVMSHNRMEDPRSFSLSPMNLSLEYDCVDELDSGATYKLYLLKRRILYKIYRFLGNDSNSTYRKMIKHGVFYSPMTYEFCEDLCFKRNVVFAEGCFQAKDYFDKYKKEIQLEFHVCLEPSGVNKNLIKEISSENAVCVHVRRGDFLNSRYSNHLAICDYDYYVEAMNYIANQIANPTYYIFSNTHDDIMWIKENYDFSAYNIRYVDLSNPDYEELRLMYSCKHFVISNSTFSWWAQYLSENDEKIVVAPSIWNRNEIENAKRIYMQGWHLIEV